MVDVTNIGTNTGSVVSTVAITVPAGGVPSGSLIVVCVADSSITGTGSVADTKSNTYTLPSSPALPVTNNNLAANGFGSLYYAFNITALVSGDTITYTLGHVASSAAVSAFYAPSILQSPTPFDNVIGTTSSGSSTTPSLSLANNAVGTGELWVAVVSNTGGSGDSFTQDSTNAAWQNFPVRVGLAGGPTIAGGAFTNKAKTVADYAPVLGVSHPWAEFMVAFRVAAPAYSLPLQLGPTLAQ